jgi:hypothetical protein
MRQQRTEAAEIEAEIARLRSLALHALRRRWRVVFGRTPPAPLRSVASVANCSGFVGVFAGISLTCFSNAPAL